MLSIVVLSSALARGNEVEHHLRNQYRGKVLMERGFYSGAHLVYDSAGNPTAGGRAGDWTTDGFVRIDDIQLSGQRVKIKAIRLMVVSEGGKGLRLADESGKKGRKSKKPIVVEIEAALDSNVSDEDADALMSKIFLSSRDSFADVVPGYWRPCIDESFLGKNENCRFSSDMMAVPGMTTPSRTPTATEMEFSGTAPAGPNATTTPVVLSRVGQGIRPPRATYQPEPSFSEPARKAKYQGVVTMGLIVDKDGLPKKIHITNPLGAGLDAKAVEAVSTWKFQPAEKDGEPVAVQIAVEVDFHLY